MKTRFRRLLPLAAAAGFLLAASTPASASSHMDAPLITLDDAANTTDVYAFVQQENGQKVLVTALGVYPFEEPGIGPNKFNFDDNVLYQIHVATGRDVAAGRATISYQFKFDTRFKNEKTILQSYTGVVQNVNDLAQNLTQYYTVTKVDHRTGKYDVLGKGVVPPNNQGNATPFYNQPCRWRRRMPRRSSDPRVVEPLIAASVVYVGLENLLRPRLPPRWKVTFGFGLIHGFGFAGALRELGIGSSGLAVALPLGAFNLGVEAGQMAVALVTLPLLWALRAQPALSVRFTSAGSLLIAVAGGYWLFERMLAQ